jgi:hypothetical protein
MRTLILFLFWLILLVLCWPLALFAMILLPLVLLLSIPLRLIGFSVYAVVELIKAILLLPARVLGSRP